MLKIPIENREYIEKLKELFKSTFPTDRIVFLGLHGSSRYSALAPKYTSDVDLELILDVINPEDLILIREIVNSVSVKVECQVRSYYEVKEQKSLISRTKYKIFMYFAYANSVTLLGMNVYKKLVDEFSDRQYKDSLLLTAQLAWKDIRKYFLDRKQDFEINKLVEVFLFDILLFIGAIPYKELDKEKIFESKRYDVFKLSADFFSEILSIDEYKQLKIYSENHRTGVFDPQIIKPLQKILSFVESKEEYFIK